MAGMGTLVTERNCAPNTTDGAFRALNYPAVPGLKHSILARKRVPGEVLVILHGAAEQTSGRTHFGSFFTMFIL